MNFNDKVTQLTLEVGGSHYPSVNPHLHQQLVKLVVKECVEAVSKANRGHVYTTFDLSQHEASLEAARKSINERFGL
jgi:methyl coenzyme M reductase gamma subunit